jgi:hypothetical protein
MMKKLVSLCVVLCCICLAVPAFSQKSKGSFYQLKVYQLKDKDGEAKLDAYLQQAYLPALHRAGIAKVGVFKPVPDAAAATSDQKLYVLIPFKSVADFATLDAKLNKDKQYLTAAQEYINAAPKTPVYTRIESILMEAFEGMPNLRAPQLQAPRNERIYELRSYEAATEKLHLNKVDMFNKGEMQLFDKLGFNAIFYGRVLAGSKLPNLMYMTAFENKEARDAHWKTFGADPEWKKMNSAPEYANNFLRADIYLLQPTSYSDY